MTESYHDDTPDYMSPIQMSAVSDSLSTARDVAAVVIGRNEGPRLEACLHALLGVLPRVIYVDSGSTDGSVAFAQALGVKVVALDMSVPFTAARARNAGLAALADDAPEFVQFLDGDCVIQNGWLPCALAAMVAEPDLGIVAGRRREIRPDRSIYNRLCDHEWDTPVGETRAVGGDMLARYGAIAGVGGFRPDLIAGEEPELCLRLRAGGWRIRRLDCEMTYHDANMTRFPQWWSRTRRAGHAFAEGSWLHGRPPERHWTAETRRALLWGAALPTVALLGAVLIHPLCLLLLLAYPVQYLRLTARMGAARALFTLLGKFPEAIGALGFYRNLLMRRRNTLIEYK